jgi:hypothetical protein
MPRGFVIALCLILGSSGPAFAQASPDSAGPMGTPITPSDLGGWNFAPTMSAEEAARDASDQGFGHVVRLREDNYGDWIGLSRKGELIVFPDGQAFPL